MEVILRDDVPGLGIIGDVVNVRPGYARNYLLPRGLAVAADRRNLKELEHQKRLVEIKKERERGSYERMAGSLSKLRLEIEMRAGLGGKLFGSVTNLDVAKLIAEQGFELDRRRIELKVPIKEIGTHSVSVRVGQDISTEVSLTVKPLGGELENVSADGEDAVVTAAESSEVAKPESGEEERAAVPEVESESAGEAGAESAQRESGGPDSGEPQV